MSLLISSSFTSSRSSANLVLGFISLLTVANLTKPVAIYLNTRDSPESWPLI